MREPVAVIGCAGTFPGGANTDDYWNVLNGRGTALREVPADRFDINKFYATRPRTGGKICSRYGGFLDEVDCFDHEFFGMTEREASASDPQHRLLMQAAWAALEDAAVVPAKLSKSRTGVFFGLSTWDYNKILNTDTRFMNAYTATGSLLCVAANRVSYLLNLRGPSMAVDAACSSSLLALHLACQSLNTGESDMAIVGAANIIASPETGIVLSQAGVLATDGRCKSFDAAADGYGRSEGCAAFVLKRLSDASRDEDSIWGIIRGSAVNHNGHGNGFVAPSGLAQQAVISDCLLSAGVLPSDVSFVETHGTGTRMGDPIEVGALREAYAPQGLQRSSLWLGAAKAVIGHCEAASGASALLKVLLAMRHERLPAQPPISQINPFVEAALKGSALRILTEPQEWHDSANRRRHAAINSFGLGGVNAHVILESPTAREPLASSSADLLPLVLPISAKTPSGLRELARRTAQWLVSPAASALSLPDICHTAQSGRTHFRFRYVCAGLTGLEISEHLSHFAQSEATAEVRGGTAHAASAMNEDAVRTMLAAAEAYQAGCDIDWGTFACIEGRRAHRINGLPSYPFARHRHWVNAISGLHLLARESEADTVPGNEDAYRSCIV